MGIATPPPSQPLLPHLNNRRSPFSRPLAGPNSVISMSQGFNHGIFSYSDGFDRSTHQDHQQQHHIAQQSRRDKLRVQGYGPTGHPLVSLEEEGEEPGIYEPTGAGNMLSEMFNFPTTPGPGATDLLANQIPSNYRLPPRQATVSGYSGDWYGSNRQHDGTQQQHAISALNTDSATAMQLFLMNPPPPPHQHPRSPSPPPAPVAPPALHHHPAAAYQTVSFGDGSFGGGVVESQGLSLSLSSSLPQFEMAKAEELRVREGVLYFNNQQMQGHGQQSQHSQGPQVHMGYGPMGVVNLLRSSRFIRAAQELLEEFCSVGRGQVKGSRIGRHNGSSNPNPTSASTSGAPAGGSSSSSKDLPPLSSAERFEHQRRKAKLLSMLDEVDRRYNHYCDQMQMVVNSFDSVMGFGAATPYTALAQKAMSRHFRCLKDAIAAQLKQTSELLGDKEGGSSSGITKGETPRLKLLEQSLRQQRAFSQIGMMEQEAWRPQRGLPERSVNVLRAWLFEHFLHPYPTDADKHLLARQTGLSRNQVSNWFINARVRLWKPMVEEMYQQESKEQEEGAEREKRESSHQRAHSPTQQHRRPEPNAPESDIPIPMPPRFPSGGNAHQSTASSIADDTVLVGGADTSELCGQDGSAGPARYVADYGTTDATVGPATRVRFGAAGDVSLTLGLRHAGNQPEKTRFSVRDFGGC